MFQFLHSLFGTHPPPSGAATADSIRAAVERVVDGVDPRLRAVPHYQRTLWQPVQRAVTYLAESVKGLPPAIPFDRRRSQVDPRLRALFLDPDHVLETLSSSPDVRGFVAQSAGPMPPELFVALRVERTERTILGMSLIHDRLMRDVPQTTVSFHNHRVAFPAANESETRRQVQARAFDYLIEVTRHRLTAKRARRMQLEQQLHQGHAKAAAAARLGWGDREAAAPALANPTDGQRMREMEGELGQLRADTATFSEQLALVADMVGEPGRHLRLDRVSMTLDNLNVKVPTNARKAADTLTFNEMQIGADRRITLEMIRFPSDQLLEQPDFLTGYQRASHQPG
ncbi:MAG TPA: hypothetical protein VES73_09165 [Lamprocystis sp. (in: g-proteobacteria)]|nr:hypothetical protein [Lamprocystis sp. (in: g-proteobacteria)]